MVRQLYLVLSCDLKKERESIGKENKKKREEEEEKKKEKQSLLLIRYIFLSTDLNY